MGKESSGCVSEWIVGGLRDYQATKVNRQFDAKEWKSERGHASLKFRERFHACMFILKRISPSVWLSLYHIPSSWILHHVLILLVRTTFLTTSVRISPAHFTENLLSHRSSLNRFLFVSLLWHLFIFAPKADIIFLSTFKTGRCRRSVQLTNFRCSQG